MIRLSRRTQGAQCAVYFPNHAIVAVVAETDDGGEYAVVVLSSGLTYEVEETAYDIASLRRGWEMVAHYRVTNAQHTTAIGIVDGKLTYEFDHRMRNLSKQA